MSTFAGTTFAIFPEVTARGRFWPAIRRDADGLPRYRAEIRVDSEAEYSALMDRVATAVTFKRGLGSQAWTAVVDDDSAGSGLLSVPSSGQGGAIVRNYTAVLVGMTPRGSGDTQGTFDAEAEWVVLTDVTP